MRDHELAHVEFLKQALGSAARAKPAFDFKGTTSDADKFRATAIVLEDTGVAAYDGQGPRLRKDAGRRGADRFGRGAPRRLDPAHRRRPGLRRRPPDYPAPAALNPALTKAQVEAAVGQTGFIKG